MHWHEQVSWSLQGSLRGNYTQLLQWECEAGAHREMCGKMFPLCSLPPLWAWVKCPGSREEGGSLLWVNRAHSSVGTKNSKNKVGPTGTSVSIWPGLPFQEKWSLLPFNLLVVPLWSTLTQNCEWKILESINSSLTETSQHNPASSLRNREIYYKILWFLTELRKRIKSGLRNNQKQELTHQQAPRCLISLVALHLSASP